jgi:hypothetical protein
LDRRRIGTRRFRLTLEFPQEEPIVRIIARADLFDRLYAIPEKRHRRCSGCRGPKAEMEHMVPLAVAQVILMPVAWLHHQHLPRRESKLFSVQVASVGAAVNEDYLVIHVLMPRILIAALHAQQVKIIKNRSHTNSWFGELGAAETLLEQSHEMIFEATIGLPRGQWKLRKTICFCRSGYGFDQRQSARVSQHPRYPKMPGSRPSP